MDKPWETVAESPWTLHGPTRLTTEEDPGWDVLDKNERAIAFVYNNSGQDAEKTANLIKVAPKLLEAVRRVSGGANDGFAFYEALVAEAEGKP